MVSQLDLLKKQRRQQLQLQRTIQRQKQQAQLRLSQQRQQQQTQQQQSKEEQEKAKKEQQQLQTQLNSTIDKINQGKITSLSQIPESQLKYLDKTQIQKAIEQRKQVEKGRKAKKQYQQAVKVYTGQTSAGALEGIPKSIRESAKKYVESSPSLSGSEKLGLSGLTQEQINIQKAGLGGVKLEIPEVKVTGGEFVDPLTGLGYSSKYDLGQQGYVQTAEIVKVGGQTRAIPVESKIPKEFISKQPIDFQQISSDFKDVSMSETDIQAFSPFGVTKDLSSQKSLVEQNGFSNISSGYISDYNTLSGGQSTTYHGDSFFTRFFARAKETYDKGETPYYSRELGMFVSASPTGESATAYLRPPTLEEKEKLETLPKYEQKVFGVEKRYETIFGLSPKEIKVKQQQAEKIDKLVVELNELTDKYRKEGKLDISDYFTEKATQEDIDIYNKLYSEYDIENKRLINRNVYVGVGSLGREIDISQVEIGVSQIPQITSILGGEKLAKAGKEEGIFQIPGFETTIIEPTAVQRKTIEFDLLTGKPKEITKDIVIEPIKVGTKEQLRTIGGVGATIGLYSIPVVGTRLFTYEVGKEFKQVGYSPVKFAKENPIETVLLGRYGVFKGFKYAPKVYEFSKFEGVKSLSESKYGLLKSKKGESQFQILEQFYKKEKKKKSILDIDSPMTQLFIEVETKRAGEFEKLLGELRRVKNKEELTKVLKKFKGKSFSQYEKIELQNLISSKTYEITGQNVLFTDRGYFISGKPKVGVKGLKKTEIPSIKIKPKIVHREQQRMVNLLGLGMVQKEKQKEEVRVNEKQVNKVGQAFNQVILQSSSIKEVQRMKELEKLYSPTDILTGREYKPPRKLKKPKIRIPLRFDDEELKRQQRLARQPTNLYVKSQGRFRKINKKPIERQIAQNMGFYITDQTLSRQFKLKKAKGKVSKPSFNVPANYGRIFGFKFRPYKKVRGRKQPLVNQFIERKQYIGDTQSELRRLNVAKFVAEQKRRNLKVNVNNIGRGILGGF